MVRAKKTNAKKQRGLKNVQPLRTDEQIKEFRETIKFLGKVGQLADPERDQLLFTLGIDWGLRASDLVALTVADVKDKDHFLIKEQKTGKGKYAKINDNLKKQIANYIESHDLDADDWLFPSRSRDRKTGERKHIQRQTLYKMLEKVADYLDWDNIGTHTLRKTFAYHLYRKTGNIALVQELLNHSSQAVTLRYIGITQDELDNALEDFYL